MSHYCPGCNRCSIASCQPTCFMGKCQCNKPHGSLTFAEAAPMLGDLLGPWETCTGGEWVPLALTASLTFLLHPDRKFRRSLPRRSRVQEMAAGHDTKGCDRCGYTVALASAYTGAIRAVCELLERENVGPRAVVGPLGPESAWAFVEREFLVPK